MILDGLTLPDTLKWANEYDWNAVAQTQDRAVTGAMIVQEQLKHYGREINLTGTEKSNWIPKSTMDALNAKEAQLNKKMAVTLPDGQAFTVMFNRNGSGALKARQVFDWEGIPTPDTNYTIQSLRLITVEP